MWGFDHDGLIGLWPEEAEDQRGFEGVAVVVCIRRSDGKFKEAMIM